jgi:hypothetical protein
MMSENVPEEGGAYVLLSFRGDNFDPPPLIALIPLAAVRPRRKGEPVSRPRNGKPPVLAKTGGCSFTTDDQVASGDPNDHVRFLLGIVQERIGAIREIMREQSLTWTAWVFEGDREGQKMSDVDAALIRRATDLGLPLLRKEPDRYMLVYDVPSPPGPSTA